MYPRMRGLSVWAFLAVIFPLAAQNPAAAQGVPTREAVQERLSKNTGSEIPDLSGLDLRRLDLSGLDFRQANLMKARLDSANQIRIVCSQGVRPKLGSGATTRQRPSSLRTPTWKGAIRNCSSP